MAEFTIQYQQVDNYRIVFSLLISNVGDEKFVNFIENSICLSRNIVHIPFERLFV